MQSPDPTPYPLDHLPLRGGPDSLALIMRDETISYAALEKLVGGLAAALRDMGLNNGDRVATWLPKTRLACLMPLAAARAGLVHVPINPAFKRAQVGHILADSGARLLVTPPARAALLAEGDDAALIAKAARDHKAGLADNGRLLWQLVMLEKSVKRLFG